MVCCVLANQIGVSSTLLLSVCDLTNGFFYAGAYLEFYKQLTKMPIIEATGHTRGLKKKRMENSGVLYDFVYVVELLYYINKWALLFCDTYAHNKLSWETLSQNPLG